MQLQVLILCTGNSCRSQMAEGFLKTFNTDAAVYSAGTRPEKHINPFAVRVMREEGIDISQQKPDPVTRYLEKDWDYVITVCDHAREVCPIFPGKVRHRLHMGFPDPADSSGTEQVILADYRSIRDQIKAAFMDFNREVLTPENCRNSFIQ